MIQAITFKNLKRAFSLGTKLVLITGFLFSLNACKKDSGSGSTTTEDDGLLPGQCRVIVHDSDAITYSGTKITGFGNYKYTYKDTLVSVADAKSDSMTYKFSMNKSGFPASVGAWGFQDTIPFAYMLFYYNADNTLRKSVEFTRFGDKYTVSGKNLYTWTAGNLTRILNFGSDTSVQTNQFNVVYDLTKTDTRKTFKQQILLNSPIYANDLMEGVSSVNLPSSIQQIITGGSTYYNKMAYVFDAKNNVTLETYQDATNAEIYHLRYTYQCK
ncbi:MAG: hypothetical protein CFE21_10700 [Bacteroidetes bacterium B1(2017)]|nr:MAG: hypothetical protein CFE21_10700 [Bacteroidetes bacterium B1(2017)]